ncbi:ATP-binding protein [Undibacterium sp. CY18W]|uniref:ATP-binding protein n=1 Tax=Undibacterium hunanense TaxID=2762292 RepID=A0ABR6ZUG2_9BURK|nr:ATP-binding protein [Undibacterium hunanense]MBC3919193.1 ATP-binding protein [Undibacterium hunanense]
MDVSSKAGSYISTTQRSAQCDSHGAYDSTAILLGTKVMHWSACPHCVRQANMASRARAAQQAVEERQRRLETRLNQAGIPLRFRTKDFASFVADTDDKEKALSVAMEFAHNFSRHRHIGTTMVFSGMPGTGKSHLATAIARHVMGSHTILYTSAMDAVRMIRDTWRRDAPQSETQILQMLAEIDLLILDEVGMQYGSEAEQISLFDIIDKRYRDVMPTMLITNQNRHGLRQFLGDRSFDRLRENSVWQSFNWTSQRGQIMHLSI